MSAKTPDQQEESERRRRLFTLLIASLSSAVAAIVVRKIWGPGTVFGAAATPVIVAFVADGLNKPAEKIRTVAVPVLTGSRPAADAPARAHGRPRPRGADGQPQEATVQAETAVPAPRIGRGGLLAALGVGLVAFVVGVGLLTGGELVFGDSTGPNERRTTVFGGSTSKSKEQKQKQDKQQKSTPTAPGQTAPSKTETTTQTTTETTPAAPPPPTTTDEQPTDPDEVAPPEATPPPSGTTGP